MTDRSWPEKGTELTVGDSIEGVYVSKKENVGANSSNVYALRTAGGELVGVWGSTVIDAQFDNISLGSEVALEYLGLRKPKSGGKPYKDFFVGIGEVPAGSAPAPKSQGNSQNTDDEPF